MLAETLRKCYEINLNDYENIGVNLQINKVLLIAFLVFAAVTVLLEVYRMNTRTMIVQLIRHEAKTKDGAKTLTELGLENNRVIKYLLSNSSLLSKTVGRIGEKKYTYEEYVALGKEEKAEFEKIDFETEQFYIKDECLDRAMHISEKYDSTTVKAVMTCVFLFVIYMCIASAMPELLRLIDGALKSTKM